MEFFPSLKSMSANIVVAAVGLALAPAPNVFAGAGFNSADVKGDFSLEFRNSSNNNRAVGLFSADGRNSCTWSLPPPGEPPACSYTVDANGKVTIFFASQIYTAIVFPSNDNANFDGLVNSFLPVAEVRLVKQNAPASGFNNADLKGSYSWKSPYDVFNVNFPSASLFTADGAGNCSLLDFFFLPTFTSFAPGFTCLYTVQPNGVVILTTNSGVPFTFVLNNKGAGATGIYGAVGPGQDGSKFITLTKQ
jgi:hypothetical protein